MVRKLKQVKRKPLKPTRCITCGREYRGATDALCPHASTPVKTPQSSSHSR